MTQQPMTAIQRVQEFFNQTDEAGISNLQKTANAQVILRVESTDASQSYETADTVAESAYPLGMVVEDGRLIGFGIHIFNQDVYPLQSFEIYLRGIDLTGDLDLSNCEDLVFVDVYNNRISSVEVVNCPSLRILGLQGNCISELDPTELPSCQGIDAGRNRLTSIDVSHNPKLVELYVNDNQLTMLDPSHNPLLKYLYCHHNQLTCLDTRDNPLLRHLDATDNPMRDIWCLAPQREERLPLELHAEEGGHVGLKFCPVYNAQWKETGEWLQSYHAYPLADQRFLGWFNEEGALLSTEANWADEYGTSRVLSAHFEKAVANR